MAREHDIINFEGRLHYVTGLHGNTGNIFDLHSETVNVFQVEIALIDKSPVVNLVNKEFKGQIKNTNSIVFSLDTTLSTRSKFKKKIEEGSYFNIRLCSRGNPSVTILVDGLTITTYFSNLVIKTLPKAVKINTPISDWFNS